MRVPRSSTLTLLSLLLTLGLAGCAGMSGDGITDLTLQISVSDGVNPDRSGRPSPVFLQIYELRDPGSFREADYLDVYQDPAGALGGAYLATSEVGPLYPGTTVVETLRLTPTAVAVGILGEFSRYRDMDSTMRLVEFPPGEDATVQVQLNERGLMLQ